MRTEVPRFQRSVGRRDVTIDVLGGPTCRGGRMATHPTPPTTNRALQRKPQDVPSHVAVAFPGAMHGGVEATQTGSPFDGCARITSQNELFVGRELPDDVLDIERLRHAGWLALLHGVSAPVAVVEREPVGGAQRARS